MSEAVLVVEWLLIVEAIGLAAFPLAASFLNLPDRGYSVSKLVGLLLTTYVVWLTVSLRISVFGLGVVVFALLVVAFISLRRFGTGLRHLRGAAAKSELVFVGSFLVFTLVIMNKPDIYGPNSEDFMDFAFLQSILRGAYFPPPDPWMAGETLSYYYFGQLTVAILTKLSGIEPTVAYNLAAVTFFALTVQAAYGVGYNLTRRFSYGLLTALFVSVSGTMAGFLQLVAYLVPEARKFIHYTPLQVPDIHQWLLKFDFWNSMSIIPQTFNFYPYHTFAHGFLHAYMVSIPFQVMLVTLGLSLFRTEKVGWWSIFLLGISIGFFSGLNTWEYPTYLLFAYLVFFLKHRKEALYLGTQTTAISFIMYLPYYAQRGSGGFGGIFPVAQRTSTSDFFEVFALFVLLVLSFLLAYFWQHRGDIYDSLNIRFNIHNHTTRLASVAAVVPLAVLVYGIAVNLQALYLLAAVSLASAYWVFKSRESEEKFVLLLALLGSLVALFPEVFFVVDAMPWKRFNTIMKLHLQVWVLWGIVSSYAVYYVMRHRGSSRFKTAAWVAVVVFVVFASLIHPIASTTSWTSGTTFFGTSTRGTLDGALYLAKTETEDYMAIQWMNRNITGHQVILEAPGSAYSYSSRISVFTGLPTVIGWTSHEQMWHSNWDKIEKRVQDADTIYSTTDTGRAVRLLRKYRVQYVYVGGIEKGKYQREGLLKFNNPEFFEPIYNETAQVYRVK